MVQAAMMTLDEFLAEWRGGADRVLVHTSGSTGKPKPMLVEKRRMAASARITCSFLGLKQGDTALLCMPLDYIAGKMMAVRAEVCGLRLLSVPPSAHPLVSLDAPPVFAAMVPMQVYGSLRVPRERGLLRGIRHLIIGGGAVDDSMAAELRGFPNAVWSTYGMTETLSHVALRRLSGPEADEWYTPLGGVAVSLTAGGCLVIDAPAVSEVPVVTNDVAELAPDGRRFRILGRKDNVICSGGIKIQAEEVERRLARHLRVPFMVTHRPDPKFGQTVVLLVQAADTSEAEGVCRRVLPKYWQPHFYVAVDRLPLTATGKPARASAVRLAEAAAAPEAG